MSESIDYDDLYFDIEANSDGVPREMVKRAYLAGREAAERELDASLNNASIFEERLRGGGWTLNALLEVRLNAADAIAFQRGMIEQADRQIAEYRRRAERAEADNAALRQQIAEAIRLYPQLAERITSSAPDPSFGNPRTP